MIQPEYKEMVDAWVDAHAEEMIKDLKVLVRIPSVKGEAMEGMPYGEMPARAVQAMQEMMEHFGLRTTNYENHCVAADLDAPGEKELDILAHLDVVPVSDSWTKTGPFEPLVEGDRIYGRGTSDDKGPAVAALYAIRCIRELGLKLKKGVRLVCGSDEECGSQDLEYYYSREEEAPCTFSPDADYPLINIEKGRLQKSFYASMEGMKNIPAPGSTSDSLWPGSASDFSCLGGTSDSSNQGGVRVVSIDAGDTVNVVPGKGSLVLSGVSEEILGSAAKETEKTTCGRLEYREQDGKMYVTAFGNSSHAADPEQGVNSVTMILDLLKRLAIGRTPGEKILLEIGRLWPHGDCRGQALGVTCADEESGSLTMSLDVLKYEADEDGSFRLKGTFDSRIPLCCRGEEMVRTIRSKLEEAGCMMEEGGMVPAHSVSADSELVQKLLQSYELYFGKKGKPIAIGGGTYVHDLKRGVAFGCAVPEVDNRMHGDDEFMEIPMLVRSTKIMADAILRLCGISDV